MNTLTGALPAELKSLIEPTLLKVSVAADLIDAERAIPQGGTLVWS